jgi:hypothetical protein
MFDLVGRETALARRGRARRVLAVKKPAFPAENELTPAPSDRTYHARALLI